MLGAVYVKSELEVQEGYIDILLTPRENQEKWYGVLIEFKYIKKEDYEQNNKLLKIKQIEAKEQLLKYKKSEEIQKIQNLKCYIVVAIKDELVIEELI